MKDKFCQKVFVWNKSLEGWFWLWNLYFKRKTNNERRRALFVLYFCDQKWLNKHSEREAVGQVSDRKLKQNCIAFRIETFCYVFSVISTDFTKKICPLGSFLHQNVITTHIFNIAGLFIAVQLWNGNYRRTKLSTILNLAQLDDELAAVAVAIYTVFYPHSSSRCT